MGNKRRDYEPHVLEIPEIVKKEVNSEKTIYLNPTKYKFNKQTKQTKQKGIIERFLYWLLIG